MIIKILLLIIVYIVSCFFNYSIGWDKGYNVGRQTEAEEWYLRNIEAIMKHNKDEKIAQIIEGKSNE